MIFFMNQKLTKKKKEDGILVYISSQNTIYLNNIFFSISLFFPHLCFSSFYFVKFQFNPVILDLFGIEFYNFFNLFFMRLCQSHNPDHEFDSVYLSFSSFS